MVERAPATCRDVFAAERQEHIARIVEEHGRVRVADLSTWFGVSRSRSARTSSTSRATAA